MFYLVLQDGVKDDAPQIRGPFSSYGKAKTCAEDDYDHTPGWIFTILNQDNKTGEMGIDSYAIVRESPLNWQ